MSLNFRAHSSLLFSFPDGTSLDSSVMARLVEEVIGGNWITCGVYNLMPSEKSQCLKHKLYIFSWALEWVLRWSHSSQDLPCVGTLTRQLLYTVPHPSHHWLPVAQYSVGPDGQNHFYDNRSLAPFCAVHNPSLGNKSKSWTHQTLEMQALPATPTTSFWSSGRHSIHSSKLRYFSHKVPAPLFHNF